MLGLIHHGGHMQQGLGGNAAAEQAGPSESLIPLDDRDLHPEIGGEEGRGMHMLMGDLPYERLTIALGGVAASRSPGDSARQARPASPPSTRLL